MTQADRDRLVTLRKAKKKRITQQAAAEELGLSVRQVKRMLRALKERGDRAVVHALRGQASNRKIGEEIEKRAVKILSDPVYQGFGPTLAAEYLQKKHKIEASKETVRQWMMGGGLWHAKNAKIVRVHTWRERRSRWGELVQWDTSEHHWLEQRGPKLYLIAMIDDATSRLLARFVTSDSTAENMRLLWTYLETHGRPLAFYTDKASLFRTAEKRRRDAPGVDQDAVRMPPTQIGRALGELGIGWIAAHSPQAKGRVERNFETAQDRLVKGLRVAGAKTIQDANRYLVEEYLPWWQREKTVVPAQADDAHRKLEKQHSLTASLSHVETRQVRPDYTLRWDGHLYQIERRVIVPGLRGAIVRVEQRLEGSLAVRHQDRYLPIEQCSMAERVREQAPLEQQPKPTKVAPRGSDWNRDFDLHDAPKIWQASQASGHRRPSE